jgi:hypothetical protein
MVELASLQKPPVDLAHRDALGVLFVGVTDLEQPNRPAFRVVRKGCRERRS